MGAIRFQLMPNKPMQPTKPKIAARARLEMAAQCQPSPDKARRIAVMRPPKAGIRMAPAHQFGWIVDRSSQFRFFDKKPKPRQIIPLPIQPDQGRKTWVERGFSDSLEPGNTNPFIKVTRPGTMIISGHPIAQFRLKRKAKATVRMISPPPMPARTPSVRWLFLWYACHAVENEPNAGIKIKRAHQLRKLKVPVCCRRKRTPIRIRINPRNSWLPLRRFE